MGKSQIQCIYLLLETLNNQDGSNREVETSISQACMLVDDLGSPQVRFPALVYPEKGKEGGAVMQRKTGPVETAYCPCSSATDNLLQLPDISHQVVGTVGGK